MSRLRVLICRVDDEDEEKMTELASFEITEVAARNLEADRALDDLEGSTHQVGQQILRGLLQARWEEIDKELVERHRQQFSPWGGNG